MADTHEKNRGGLLVPLAICPDGTLRRAHDVRKEDGPFTCPHCGDSVDPRAGDGKSASGNRKAPVRHYYHPKRSDGGSGCSKGETEDHWLAKHCIAMNPHRFRFFRECSECSRVRPIYDGADSLPQGSVEQPIGDFKVDALLVSRTRNQRIVVEIFKSHKVGDDKRRQLELAVGRDCVFEITAEKVVECHRRSPMLKIGESEGRRKPIPLAGEGDPYDLVDSVSDRCAECQRAYERYCDGCRKVKICDTKAEAKIPYICRTCSQPCVNCKNATSRQFALNHHNLCRNCHLIARSCDECGEKSAFHQIGLPHGEEAAWVCPRCDVRCAVCRGHFSRKRLTGEAILECPRCRRLVLNDQAMTARALVSRLRWAPLLEPITNGDTSTQLHTPNAATSWQQLLGDLGRANLLVRAAAIGVLQDDAECNDKWARAFLEQHQLISANVAEDRAFAQSQRKLLKSHIQYCPICNHRYPRPVPHRCQKLQAFVFVGGKEKIL